MQESKKDILSIGDTVSWKGHGGVDTPHNVNVLCIIITPKGGSDRKMGTPVDSIEWDKLIGENVLVGISDGLWAYGSKINKVVRGSMKEATHFKDPAKVRRILYVGDTVLAISGKNNATLAKVTSITLTENAVLDGIDVPAVPWVAKEFFTVTLDDGTWKYGEQLKMKE